MSDSPISGCQDARRVLEKNDDASTVNVTRKYATSVYVEYKLFAPIGLEVKSGVIIRGPLGRIDMKWSL